TRAKEDQIERTIDSLVGAKRVIIHLYNSTSPEQREIVFKKSKTEIIKIAENGTRWIKDKSRKLIKNDTEVTFQYSPESWSSTEPEFGLEICEAVMNNWEPTVEQPMILNLPATVEVSTPNVYADMIEWFHSKVS